MTQSAPLLPRLRATARQFVSFGVGGVIGLMVDMGVLWVCIRVIGMDPLSGRGVSFLFSVTTTWAYNRTVTFAGARDEPILSQWAKFAAANSVGFAVNYATYAALIATTVFFAAYPEAAVACGSLAGMLFNFTASKKMVFRERA